MARSVYNGQRYSVIVMYHMVYTIRIKICLIFVYHERKIIHNVLLIATNSIWAIKYISLSSVFPSSSSPFFHVLYGFSFVSEQNQKRKHSTSIIFHNSKTMKAKPRQRERACRSNKHAQIRRHALNWIDLNMRAVSQLSAPTKTTVLFEIRLTLNFYLCFSLFNFTNL